MADLSPESLKALSAEEIAARLRGSPDERVALILSAAEAGVAEAQALFGQMLLDGAELPADPPQALQWFAKAAAQQHVMAINMVGRCYDLGWGTPVDKARAAEWYQAAALRGLDWGMYNYATLLALGHGVPQDRAVALDWFRKADAATGNAKAINFIGSFYEDGWVVDRDLVTAAIYYERAAQGGDFRGQFNHARMLGDKGQADEALIWLDQMKQTATPAFLKQAADWLTASAIPQFRAHAATF